MDASKLRPSNYQDDRWLRVVGTTAKRGRKLIVVASRIEPVSKPAKPYLTP